VAYRDAHGAFRRVEELLLVQGMTPQVLAKIRPYVAL
jgi:DNA uptake protein ComE-like DNA-binding protein